MNWYQLEVNKIFAELDTSEQGLTGAEAGERLQRFGLNRLAEAEKISRLKILLHQFTSPLIYILLIAAVVTAFLQEYKDTGVILAILLINAIVGFIQEYKAEKNVRALKSMVVASARVLRDGKRWRLTEKKWCPATSSSWPPGGGCRRTSDLSRPSS